MFHRLAISILSFVRSETTQQVQRLAAVDTWPAVKETCPKCGAKEVRYTTLQLRSADEGTTLFYLLSGLLRKVST